MSRRGPLNIRKLLNRRLPEPGKLIEGKKQLLRVQQQPEAVLGDVRNFSGRSDSSRHFRCEVERSRAQSIAGDPTPSRLCNALLLVVYCN